MPVKVLTYLHSYEVGGVEHDILRFNKAWAATGIDVHIALGRAEGPLASDMPDVPCTLFQTGGLSSARFETLWMIWHLPALIRRLRPDVLFCAGNSYSIVAIAVRLLMGRACPPMILRVSNELTRRDMPWPMRQLYYFWLRLHPCFFAAIVAMAEPARAEIVERMRVDPARIVTIENGSLTDDDTRRFARARDTARRDHSGRHYLAVGRLSPQKNFALLIDAFAAIATPEDRLTIVGEGAQRAALEARAARLGIADRVAMPGHSINPAGHYAAADALVVSSDYEGLGIVVIEALAAGLPVVATDCGPNMAMLLDGVGRLVPPRDAAALAGAMVLIADDPVDLPGMRTRAARFTIETVTADWVRLFAGVAAATRPFVSA